MKGKEKNERRKLKIWFMHKITGSLSISQLKILDLEFTLFAPPKIELLLDIWYLSYHISINNSIFEY